ncbi:MAG: hypothetical protein LQ352_004680 [Teloschistes flavicans]|nr:MAG: hypothetical protein LQ352_004680 [Teloschistes flavicans]
MKILCLHGYGMNASVSIVITQRDPDPSLTSLEPGPANPARSFALCFGTPHHELTKEAPLVYELGKTHDLHMVFVNGPTPAPPAVGIAGQYEGPFCRWFDAEASSPVQLVSGATHTTTSPEDHIRTNMRHRGLTNVDPTNACDYIEKIMQTHDEAPFDGILGFSEGAAASAGWLFRQAAQGSKLPIKFALFLCGTPPAHFEQKDVLLADETSERIGIPTAHIVGSRDPAYQSGLALYNLCEKASARIYEHGKGHTVPWDLQITQAMAKEIRAVISSSDQGEDP